jgi:hypothetical protein
VTQLPDEIEARDGRPGLTWLYDDVIDEYAAHLKPSGMAVYAYICRCVKGKKGKATIAVAECARRMGMDRKTARAGLKRVLAPMPDGVVLVKFNGPAFNEKGGSPLMRVTVQPVGEEKGSGESAPTDAEHPAKTPAEAPESAAQSGTFCGGESAPTDTENEQWERNHQRGDRDHCSGESAPTLDVPGLIQSNPPYPPQAGGISPDENDGLEDPPDPRASVQVDPEESAEAERLPISERVLRFTPNAATREAIARLLGLPPKWPSAQRVIDETVLPFWRELDEKWHRRAGSPGNSIRSACKPTGQMRKAMIGEERLEQLRREGRQWEREQARRPKEPAADVARASPCVDVRAAVREKDPALYEQLYGRENRANFSRVLRASLGPAPELARLCVRAFAELFIDLPENPEPPAAHYARHENHEGAPPCH